MTDVIRIKTESQAFWESDDNLTAACKWIEDNFGFKEECFIIFAGQNKRDFQSFTTAVKQGHNRATIVWDRLDQAENVWLNNIKQKILDSGDNKAIAKMYKFFDQRKRREENQQKLLEKMERKKQRLHARGILTDQTTWGELLRGDVK